MEPLNTYIVHYYDGNDHATASVEAAHAYYAARIVDNNGTNINEVSIVMYWDSSDQSIVVCDDNGHGIAIQPYEPSEEAEEDHPTETVDPDASGDLEAADGSDGDTPIDPDHDNGTPNDA